MRVNLLSLCAVIGAFGLAGLAQAASAGGAAGGGGGGGGGGHGGGGGAGGHGGGAAQASAAHGGAAHAGIGYAGALSGSRISTGALSKSGFVGARADRIDGHNATVVVFHRPLTATERDRIQHYHFKGFNECAGHKACTEQNQNRGEEVYCRRASNVAITNDLECLSFTSE